MAISFVNGGTNDLANGGDASVDMSTWSLLEDDFVIAAYSINSVDRDMVMLTSGYTEIADLFSSDSERTNLGVFYKFMSASPDASAQCEGFGDANDGVQLAATAFRGVDTSSPFDVASTTATGTNSGLADPPSIDWSTSGVWTVIASASGISATATYTFPSGYTTNAKQASRNETRISVIGLGYNSAPSDPENPGAFALSIADSVTFSWASVTIALKPAAVGGSQFIPILVGG